MKRILLLFLVLLLLTGFRNQKFGCPHSSIYAVCSVTTNDGKVHEGLVPIVLGGSGLMSDYYSYGFYFHPWFIGGLEIFFDFNFRGFVIQKDTTSDFYSMIVYNASSEKTDSLKETDFDTLAVYGFEGFPQIYFCNIDSINIFADEGYSYITKNDKKYLTPGCHGKAATYLLSESLILSQEFEINDSLAYISLSKTNVLKIPLDSIISFKIETNPSQKWKNNWIAKHKEAINKEKCSCEFINEGLFFNDIIKKSKDEINDLNNRIYK